MGAKIFKNLVITHTNDFPSSKNDKIKGWIENNGGIYSKDLDPSTTHLLASRKSWKTYTPMVRGARATLRKARHGEPVKIVKIVRLEWLEDSLMRAKPKRLDETPYYYEQTRLNKYIRCTKRNIKGSQNSTSSSHDPSTTSHGNTLAEVQLAAAKEKRIMRACASLDKACRDFQQKMAQDGYHSYTDSRNFVYIISLVRHDVLRNRLDKHKLMVGVPVFSRWCRVIPNHNVLIYKFPSTQTLHDHIAVAANLSASLVKKSCIRLAEPWAQCLQLYESDTEPRTYASFTHFTHSEFTRPVLETLAPPGSTWPFAWDMFRKFFEKRTGRIWKEAIDGDCCSLKLDGTSEYNDKFQYELHPSFEAKTKHSSDIPEVASEKRKEDSASRLSLDDGERVDSKSGSTDPKRSP